MAQNNIWFVEISYKALGKYFYDRHYTKTLDSANAWVVRYMRENYFLKDHDSRERYNVVEVEVCVDLVPFDDVSAYDLYYNSDIGHIVDEEGNVIWSV